MPATNEPMIDRDKYKYSPTRVIDPKTGKVRNSVGNGDAIARAFLSISTADLPKVARANKLNDLWDSLQERNAGQQRMGLGNALRGMVRKGEEVTIGEHVIKKLDQRVHVDEAPPAEKRVAAPKAKAAKAKKPRSKKATTEKAA